ncbi:class I SAM-dependent methyltransferase [candidate division KSB1 bacterium]|nr:class I SAM-dependent methyltransferase [candidate division KSB1 bacterium]
MNSLQKQYDLDKHTWDECAETYERQIVGGHPDILAFENFEEDFLDRVLRHLSQVQNRPVKLMDIGCGSGRLHLRYGAKTQHITCLPESHPLYALKQNVPELAFDPLIAEKLREVWGIDFSANMIGLAKEKLETSGLNGNQTIALTFEQGSAFDLNEQSDKCMPLAISLVNSIGVMQGQAGAVELFKSMRRAVEAARGIAIISCYQQEYVQSYGLGQYESTLDVSGQPVWMIPDTYASSQYRQIPKSYKLAHSKDLTLVVDVFNSENQLVKKGHQLQREPGRTERVIRTGDIDTYSEYKSHWYSFRKIDDLINEYWGTENSFHFKTKYLDALRAEPAQLAILDYGQHLNQIFKSWKVL